VSFFFCDSCNVLQPAQSGADYFNLLAIPPVFYVDRRRLKGTYKQLQQRLHPDKYAAASKEEQKYSAQQSGLVSRAYTTLRNPFRRAVYMLERAGQIAAGKSSEGLPTVNDPHLLTTVMEALEAIDEAEDESALAEVREIYMKEEARLLRDLNEAFKRSALTEAMGLTARLRYVNRIQEAIHKRSNQHEDAS